MLPAAKVGDVGDVVAGVPAVEEGGVFEVHAAHDGMDEAALPLLFGKVLEEHNQAGMDAFEDLEGPLDGGGVVVEVGPGGLVVGLDGGPVFGEGEAQADDGVHVAVGEVVNDLAGVPAAVAVGDVELGVAETLNSVAKLAGEIGKGGNGSDDFVLGDGLGAVELTNGVAGIEVRCWHELFLDEGYEKKLAQVVL